jgi:hypothetical protein
LRWCDKKALVCNRFGRPQGPLIYQVLTYMATLEDAVKAKVLEPYDLPDWERRLPIRSLWVAYELWDWTDSTGALHDMAHRIGGRTLYEHLEQMFCEFRCAPRFPAGDLRQMMPTRKGVRKLHPPKLRIYGWCPRSHAFVAVTGALEADTKSDKKLNDKKRDEVLTFIKTHKLEHLVLKGDNLAVFPPNNRS